MANEPWNWNKDDLVNLLGQSESIRLEFKESRLLKAPAEKVAETLTKEVSAFANTEGGVIVIGMAEQKLTKGGGVAANLDDGVSRDEWPPDRLQRIIEDNLSPYLTGIRVRTIPLGEDWKSVVYAIWVPQGTTAYQASDRRYYGRSEYECKALPDHEVRLRMTRGKTPSAIVTLSDWQEKIAAKPDDDTRLDDEIDDSLSFRRSRHRLLEPTDPGPPKRIVRRYVYSIYIENTGEINITEFKVIYGVTPTGYTTQDSGVWAFKDGWLVQKERAYERFYDESHESVPMTINLYPRDLHWVADNEIELMEEQSLSDLSFKMKWVLYLRDTLPIEGEIDLAQAYRESAQQEIVQRP